jgi:hypothetical protein
MKVTQQLIHGHGRVITFRYGKELMYAELVTMFGILDVVKTVLLCSHSITRSRLDFLHMAHGRNWVTCITKEKDGCRDEVGGLS